MGNQAVLFAGDGDIKMWPSTVRHSGTRPVPDFVPRAESLPIGRYGARRGPNLVALAGALIVVSIVALALTALGVISAHKVSHPPMVVELLDMPIEPPPPPPAPEVKPTTPEKLVSPVLASKQLVPVTMPPEMQATTQPAPATFSIPGPDSPSPAPAPAPAAPPAIENMGDLSSKMIAMQPPRYPIESRRKREQGTVVLQLLLGPDGSVADIGISRSSGFDRLDKAALSAVRRWRWSPTRRGGAAVMVRGLVEIPFILKS